MTVYDGSDSVALGVPTAATREDRGVVTVPLYLSVVGKALQLSDGYSLKANPRVSNEVDAILEELNEVARQVGPNMGTATAVLKYVPLVGLVPFMYSRHQYNAMNEALKAKCMELNSNYNAKGINLRFVNAGSLDACRTKRCGRRNRRRQEPGPQSGTQYTCINLEIA